MFSSSDSGYACYLIRAPSLSTKDLVKDNEMNIYIKNDRVTSNTIDRSGLIAFAHLKGEKHPSDCSVITKGWI